jgi:hypothetical protein
LIISATFLALVAINIQCLDHNGKVVVAVVFFPIAQIPFGIMLAMLRIVAFMTHNTPAA